MDVAKLHKNLHTEARRYRDCTEGKHPLNSYFSPPCASVNSVPLCDNYFVQFDEAKNSKWAFDNYLTKADTHFLHICTWYILNQPFSENNINNCHGNFMDYNKMITNLKVG